MDNIVTTGSLFDCGSVAMPDGVWTATAGLQVALPAGRGGLSAAALVGRTEHHSRIRTLVNPVIELPSADRMRASASEP
jgi:hypothetical protein